MLKIGNVEIANQIVLAPMASVSNSAYRRIAKEMGCGLIYAEMVSDKAIYYGNKKTLDLLYMTPFERQLLNRFLVVMSIHLSKLQKNVRKLCTQILLILTWVVLFLRWL